MKQLTNITSRPKQQFDVRLDDGTAVNIKMSYSAINRAWFMDIEYNGYISTCHQITNCPNIIRESQNILPFGIACAVNDGFEPWFVDDFSTGRANLYILNKDEVKEVEQTIYGKVL